ncbi:MAG: thioredoxin [Halothiobacillus sp.]
MSESPYVFNVTAAEFQARVIEASFQTPVLVDFWAAWCGPCRTLMPLLAKITESYAGKLHLAKVDTDAEQELAGHFGVRSLPTVMLVINGQQVDQFMGALPESQVREFLEKHITSEVDALRHQARDLAATGAVEPAIECLKQANAIEPNNSDILIDLAQIVSDTGDYAQAMQILDALPIDVATRKEVKELKARIHLAQHANEGPSLEELHHRVSADDTDLAARERLAAALAMHQDYEGALTQFFTLMQRDRTFNDDAGRRGLLDLFEVLGAEHPLTKTWRRKMFGLLH